MSKQETPWKDDAETLENHTRYVGDDTVCCAACGKHIETMTARFSRYTGEPLCPTCHQAEEASE